MRDAKARRHIPARENNQTIRARNFWVTLSDEAEREARFGRSLTLPLPFPGGTPERLKRLYDGGMTAILIPFRAQACSRTFGQSSSANSSVTISFTLILPLSR